MWFSPKTRFVRRCRARLKALGFAIVPSPDLQVDFLGGFADRPHVFVARPAGQPLMPSQILDLQEYRMRYWDRRFVCVTETRPSRNWVVETSQRKVFLLGYDDLALLTTLPPTDEDALSRLLETVTT